MKLTKEGIAVIEGDNYLSADIIAQGRLDVARESLLQYKPYIPEGGMVIDVGACLGDHTATFSEFVGPEGFVYAFEPHPAVAACLIHNMRSYPNVVVKQIGLADSYRRARINVDSNNIGASWLAQDDEGPIDMVALDHVFFWTWLNFIKIDAEGCEPLVLRGMSKIASQLKPVLLVEIDQRALGLQGFTPADVHRELDVLGYDFPRFDGAHGDILCVPKEQR